MSGRPRLEVDERDAATATSDTADGTGVVEPQAGDLHELPLGHDRSVLVLAVALPQLQGHGHHVTVLAGDVLGRLLAVEDRVVCQLPGDAHLPREDADPLVEAAHVS